jgi:hypothetical protein
MTKVTKYVFGNIPECAFSSGGLLERFDPDAAEVSGDAYFSKRAKALFKALSTSPKDEEMVMGTLPDGRWALMGLTISGYAFALEKDSVTSSSASWR